MSRHSESIGVSIHGHFTIIDEKTGEVIREKSNAIHPQNMARIISRGLANEGNSSVYRIAFGNGGSFVDVGGNIEYRTPNDGNNGAGWESRLYREIYSEIVDNSDPVELGTDPGSAGPDNIRVGGGTSGAATSSNHNVLSDEIGKQSRVVVSMLIDENEPAGHITENTFSFDEIGLYSSGLPAVGTSGFASINVNDKKSTDDIYPTLSAATNYALRIELDGITRDAIVTTPAFGTGSGPLGRFTYGDLCEGINSGAWISSGFDFSSANGAFFTITDETGGAYPSITGQVTFGFLNIQSKITGADSSIIIPEDQPIGANDNLVYALANNIWNNVVDETDDSSYAGKNVGVINDPVDQSNERERLLSHVTFAPVTKPLSSIYRVVYRFDISVKSVNSTVNLT